MGSCISNNIQNTDIDTNIRKSNIPVINLPIFDKKQQQLDSKIVEEDIDTNIRKSNIPPVINVPIFDKKKQQLDSKIVTILTTIIEEDTVSISDSSLSS